MIERDPYKYGDVIRVDCYRKWFDVITPEERRDWEEDEEAFYESMTEHKLSEAGL